MTPAEFESFLRSGNEAAAIKFFRGMPESDRRHYADVSLRVFLELDKSLTTSDPLQAARAALLASAAPGALTKGRVSSNDDVCFRILEERKPPWLESWAYGELENHSFAWRLVRRLVQAGLCRRPESPLWTIGFIGGGVNLRRYRRVPLRDVLLSEPDTLQTEIWKLFEVEGNQESSLAQHDKYSGPPYDWTSTLTGLAAEGKISRDRLLDASLDALQRDFAQFRAGWFSNLHEELKPTPKERTTRVSRYLALLNSRIPPTVSLALDALTIVDKAGNLDPKQLLDHVGPAILSRSKKSATAAMSLIRKAGERIPSLKQSAALLAAEGLSHEAVEVQTQALETIEQLGPPLTSGLRDAVASRRPSIAASLKKRVDALLGETPVVPAKVAATPAPSPKPKKDTRVKPAKSLDEAIAALSGAIERLEIAEEFEIALDGALRFCADRPGDFEARSGPLFSRCDKLYEKEVGHEFVGENLRLDLCAVALCWITRTPPAKPQAPTNVRGFLALRMYEIAERLVKGKSGPLFSLPTRAGGWIAPETLVDRAIQGEPSPLDAIQSLIRLEFEGRGPALKKAAAVSGEYGAALRHALGGPVSGKKTSPGLWMAAFRARDPFAEEPSFVLEKSAKKWIGIEYVPVPAPPKKTALDQPTTLLYLGSMGAGWTPNLSKALIRWTATVWPQNPTPFFAEGFRALAGNRDWWSAHWEHRHYLEPLLEREVRMSSTARLMLAAALGAKDPGEGGLATDILIQSVNDGRLQGAELGETMGLLSGKLAVTLTRWKARLADAARVSPRHAEAIREALEAFFAILPAPAPRDIASLLELFRELMVECNRPVTNADTRKNLESLGGSGRSGKLVKSLLGPEQ